MSATVAAGTPLSSYTDCAASSAACDALALYLQTLRSWRSTHNARLARSRQEYELQMHEQGGETASSELYSPLATLRPDSAAGVAPASTHALTVDTSSMDMELDTPIAAPVATPVPVSPTARKQVIVTRRGTVETIGADSENDSAASLDKLVVAQPSGPLTRQRVFTGNEFW